ncbi:hypothetical protein GGR30_002866 [Martelella radicis]|uniref:Uncharacterized protein n=2 Tax=Martelella radicis TaxID=1397476 RepID=A0A7W6KKF1_9HYPH|nr:hypothetical protein [Martelella radicis]
MQALLAAFFTKKTAPWLLAALLIAVGGISACMAVGKVSDLIDDRVASVKAERDSFWKGKIAEANAAKQEAVAAQYRAVILAGQQIRAAENAAQIEIEQMEKANAALPGGGACGLSPERVRILPY